MSFCAFIGLGANLGERAEQLRRAIELLSGSGVEVLRCSSLYETAPLGPIAAQPDFLNAVIEVQIAVHHVEQPIRLLRCCQQIEHRLGRQRGLPMGPRCIDLDLLLLGEQIIESKQLTVPHPGLTERAFVLVPLLELEPELTDPRDEQPLSHHLERVGRTQTVQRVSPPMCTAEQR